MKLHAFLNESMFTPTSTLIMITVICALLYKSYYYAEPENMLHESCDNFMKTATKADVATKEKG